MPTLKNVRMFTEGYEITTDHNTLNYELSQDLPQVTTFGSDSHSYIVGLQGSSYSFNGFFESDGTSAINDIQTIDWDAVSDHVLTVVAPEGGAGDVAYTFPGVDSSFTPFAGSIGDAASFTLAGSGTGVAFRGTVFEPGTTARSTSSNSSAYQLTGVTSGQTARASLHVIAATGSPTLDVTIESDDSGAMSTPTTRLTFTQATGQGAEIVTSATTTTDDYWRAAWTFGGTGSITFVVSFGIA
jgi:hypothetical protein